MQDPVVNGSIIEHSKDRAFYLSKLKEFKDDVKLQFTEICEDIPNVSENVNKLRLSPFCGFIGKEIETKHFNIPAKSLTKDFSYMIDVLPVGFLFEFFKGVSSFSLYSDVLDAYSSFLLNDFIYESYGCYIYQNKSCHTIFSAISLLLEKEDHYNNPTITLSPDDGSSLDLETLFRGSKFELKYYFYQELKKITKNIFLENKKY